jgi:probable rRNA maturation factor
MAFEIDVQNQGNYNLNTARLRAAATETLSQHQPHPDTTMSVVITDNDFVRNLNRQYRGVDAPTDVLSFPAEAPPIAIEGEPPYLGDLVIAYPYSAAQAQREGHDLDNSLALLVVHGTLHLLGYDHDTSEKRAQMWTAQDKVLRTLGIPTDIVPRLEEANHDDAP